MLSTAVVSAIGLHLIFRLGSRRKADLEFEQSTHPQDEITGLLRDRGRAWDIDDDVVERAASTTGQVLDHLERAHLVVDNLRAVIAYDDFTLVVTIEYAGTLLSLPNVGVKHRSFLEEESFSYGLADFLTGVYPDRMESTAHGTAVVIRLYFAT